MPGLEETPPDHLPIPCGPSASAEMVRFFLETYESDIQSDGIVRWLRYRGSTDRPVG